MKTNAKQTGKLIGSTSFMVLGILILTVLPLNTIKAGNSDKSDCPSVGASHIAIEPWMLSLDDWNTNLLLADNGTVDMASWMMAPENWDNGLETELAEATVSQIDSIDVWMMEPEGWSCDFAELWPDVEDRDRVMVPLYF